MSEVKQEGDFKIKSKPKMKDLGKTKSEVKKVDLSKKTEEPTKVLIKKEEENAKQNEIESIVQEQAEEQIETQNQTIQEIEEVEETAVEQEPTLIGEKQLETYVEEEPASEQVSLPENIEKLVSFMNETGGNIEDYVRLNSDYSSVNDDTLLREYYKKSKPHLNPEEISFLIEDKFSYDEDLDDDRDIRFKKLAIKEEVAQARSFLEQTKSKYYDEIKLRPGVTREQKTATDFFNRYNQNQKIAEQQHSEFKSNTKKYFTEDFKGFDFEVSGKKFRYGVQDPSKLAEDQSNINNFVGKFLDDKGNVVDTKGYHKALYMASNAETIINHFYEQGKSDATKEIVSSSKNPSADVRQPAQKSGFVNGIKAKVLSPQGNDFSKLKIKKIKI